MDKDVLTALACAVIFAVALVGYIVALCEILEALP